MQKNVCLQVIKKMMSVTLVLISFTMKRRYVQQLLIVHMTACIYLFQTYLNKRKHGNDHDVPMYITI